jgi:hypothetical protein
MRHIANHRGGFFGATYSPSDPKKKGRLVVEAAQEFSEIAAGTTE